MNAVDTNILIYAQDPRDLRKRELSRTLMSQLTATNEGVLLWQVACEYMNASRKLKKLGFSVQMAQESLKDLRGLWVFQLPSPEVLDRGITLVESHSLSFWDAMIIAACAESNINTLYSEDLCMYPSVAGVKLVNPFV